MTVLAQGGSAELATLLDQEKKKYQAEKKKAAELQARYKERLQQMQANGKARKSGTGRKIRKKEMTEEENRHYNAVNVVVRSYCWPLSTFCSNEDKLDNATHVVYLNFNHRGLSKMDEKQKKRHKRQWIAENREIVRKCLNEARNYATNNIRNEYTRRGAAGLAIPTPAEILDCVTREPHLMESADGRALFDDYVDNWLPKVAFAEHFGPDVRHHFTISEAVHDPDDVDKRFKGEACSPGKEAFFYMAYLNGHYGRFQKLAELKRVRANLVVLCVCVGQYANPLLVCLLSWSYPTTRYELFGGLCI